MDVSEMLDTFFGPDKEEINLIASAYDGKEFLKLHRKAVKISKKTSEEKHKRYLRDLNIKIHRAFTKKYRKTLLNLYGNKCCLCSFSYDDLLHIHHKTSVINEKDDLFNICLLCPNCHSLLHKAEKIQHINNNTDRPKFTSFINTTQINKELFKKLLLEIQGIK